MIISKPPFFGKTIDFTLNKVKDKYSLVISRNKDINFSECDIIDKNGKVRNMLLSNATKKFVRGKLNEPLLNYEKTKNGIRLWGATIHTNKSVEEATMIVIDSIKILLNNEIAENNNEISRLEDQNKDLSNIISDIVKK